GRPHPSRRAHARSNPRSFFDIRAPQDEDEHHVLQSSPYKQPFPLPRHALAGPIPVFSCFFADSDSSIPGLTISNNTHSLLPATLFAPGVCNLAPLTPNEGWAERRESFGCSGTRSARHLASKTRVNALMTRHARRLARRLASHDAGRSPLGAPPWRFFTRGRASVSFGARRPTTAGGCLPGPRSGLPPATSEVPAGD